MAKRQIDTLPLLEGTIVFAASAPAFVGATVRVFLEDVSIMDAPAPVIAEHVEHQVTYAGHPLAFKLFGEIPHTEHHYNVRVHISRDGSADIKAGDFITMQSYPVLTHGYPETIQVEVRAI